MVGRRRWVGGASLPVLYARAMATVHGCTGHGERGRDDCSEVAAPVRAHAEALQIEGAHAHGQRAPSQREVLVREERSQGAVECPGP